ncbi:hypothetical protein BC938DRAFT_476736, partial [Jimgerdemannia flammicorona]
MQACFDCFAKNPTWASVTYGVYLCTDCSSLRQVRAFRQEKSRQELYCVNSAVDILNQKRQWRSGRNMDGLAYKERYLCCFGKKEGALTYCVIASFFTSRSTVLDSWTWDQLRVMKVGGNTAATEFFSKHGSGAQLNSRDAKVKFTSKAALLYKDKLVEKAKADAI